MTDGLDGLAILPTVMVAVGLGMIAYVTGRVDFASYLNMAYIAGAGEMVVFCGAIAGAGLGFLWFNTYPAMVFMGDVGALALGAALGIVAVIIRQELEEAVRAQHQAPVCGGLQRGLQRAHLDFALGSRVGAVRLRGLCQLGAGQGGLQVGLDEPELRLEGRGALLGGVPLLLCHEMVGLGGQVVDARHRLVGRLHYVVRQGDARRRRRRPGVPQSSAASELPTSLNVVASFDLWKPVVPRDASNGASPLAIRNGKMQDNYIKK